MSDTPAEFHSRSKSIKKHRYNNSTAVEGAIVQLRNMSKKRARKIEGFSLSEVSSDKLHRFQTGKYSHNNVLRHVEKSHKKEEPKKYKAIKAKNFEPINPEDQVIGWTVEDEAGFDTQPHFLDDDLMSHHL